MAKTGLALGLGVVVGLGVAMAASGGACTASESNTFTNGSGGNSSGSAHGGSGGNASMSNGSGEGGTFLFDGGHNDGAGGGFDPDAGCVGQPFKSEQLPLDMFIMLDQSGSMSSTVQGGMTRWDVVVNALNAFVQQPNPNGISVGITYFGVPAGGSCPPSCVTNADCIIPYNNEDYGPCNGSSCAACPPFFTDSCNFQDYAKPEVEIEALPGVAQKITHSLSLHSPLTGTPTSAALQGGVQHCKDWAVANPGHVVVHVFATDGEPGECNTDINFISNIAAAGSNGIPKVLTFVIGVGSSLQNLNQIAAAGGTGQAFLVDTNANAQQQFLDALNQIRGAALGCVYTIPLPEAGIVDYKLVNVKYTPGNGGMPEFIPKVASKAQCPTDGTDAWYYDDEANPTQIILCDGTCGKVSADTQGQIDIVLGCTSVIP